MTIQKAIKPSFYDSCKVLADAWNNKSLKQGSCEACAVGNLVAASCGMEIRNHSWYVPGTKERVVTNWDDVFCGGDLGKYYGEAEYRNNDEARAEIDSTGYTWKQLAQIERAFEGTDSGSISTCTGIKRVLRKLAEIHNASPYDVDQALKMFTRKPNYQDDED